MPTTPEAKLAHVVVALVLGHGDGTLTVVPDLLSQSDAHQKHPECSS